MTDYAGNSKKSKEKAKPADEEKHIERVELTSKVVARKKPLSVRVKTIFFGGEFDAAVRYIGAEVLIPAFRNLLVDATTKGIERMVYGDSGYARPRSSSDYRPRVTYNSPINRGGRANLPDQPSRLQRARGDDTDLIFASRSDAEAVLDRLGDVLEQYDVASVADLHEIVGLPTSPMDNKWGWDNLRFAEIRQTRDGFVLGLPPTQPF